MLDDEIMAELEESNAQNLARVRRERDSVRRHNERLLLQVDELTQLLDFHDSVSASNPEPPRWLAPAKPKKGERATVVVMLSDCHFDEVVNPDELGGINAYNRTIATMRLQRWAEGVIMVARQCAGGHEFDGCAVILCGDIFSGDIHDELAQTNADTLLGSLLYWSEMIAAAFGLLVEEFGKMHVVSVVGNHGRMSKKPVAKRRAKTNVDWLLAHMLQRQLSDDRITWDIPESADAWLKVHNVTHLVTHGDQVSGGGGIGGIWPGLLRMVARKSQRYAHEGQTFDVVTMGHWHQLVHAPEQGFIVNGSLKGPDEWATAIMNFRPERPQQALWLVTPDRGITVAAPVLVTDRKAEGW